MKLTSSYCKNGIVILFLLTFVMYAIQRPTVLRAAKTATRQNKSILIWNSPERIETAAFGVGRSPFIQHGCHINECLIFDDQSALPLDNYDAIIVHVHELWLTKLPDFQRRGHQRFIFLTQETPLISQTLDVSALANVFNWTMTYRLDSDILLLYGRIHPRRTAPKTAEDIRTLMGKTRSMSAKNYAANKTSAVVWMASHCDTPSRREVYIRQLSEFIPVDIYGGCGPLTCERNHTHWLSHPKCYDVLEAKYKFYLSFENSICADYVTEKFFEIMRKEMVPVVYGGANYSRIAPPHSYINALDFTPEKLAEYLKMLDANDTLYNEFFWWKAHYRVEAGADQMARHGFCDLCRKLHQEEGVTQHYSKLVSQWDASTQCKSDL
ncbi:putative Alpha--fucosyltransferase C [Daphnia magna]|uniref:Fucosyltransferase n=1 Tax=Daphnia magna TaxID=35525 RepID=A0A164VPG7_9CRUS|nr:putative Alpha--fucosyltransferase C [Daphnia magna]